MNIFIYSDESGVFDAKHNKYYVFGGLIFLSKEEKDIASRMYLRAERAIKNKYPPGTELKASTLTVKDKNKLYRSLNNQIKFGVIVDQQELLPEIFNHKKTKQRYLDFAYKIAVRRAIETLITKGILDPSSVENIYFFVDEHTTATDGKYELREGLEQEFKYGTMNQNFSSFFDPVFKDMKDLTLHYCDSATKPLIRAADIVANNIYHKAITNNNSVFTAPNQHIITMPHESIGNKIRGDFSPKK